MEYRSGYYAPADFKHSNQEDRERQLDEELASELPSTDLPVYLAAGYFRIGEDKFFVPISLVVPGSEIPFASNSTGTKPRSTSSARPWTTRSVRSAICATPSSWP